MRDSYTQLKSALLIVPSLRKTDSTILWVDLQGFDSALIELAIGVGGITFDADNRIDFELYESDDNGSSSNLVALADILGESTSSAGIVKSLQVAHAAAAVYTFGYVGSKRYIGLLANFVGTHATETPMAATAIKGHARNAPPS